MEDSRGKQPQVGKVKIFMTRMIFPWNCEDSLRYFKLYYSSPICCMLLQFHPWKFDSRSFVLKFKKLVLFINEVGNLSFIHKWGWTVGNTSLQLSCIPLHKMKYKTELQTFWFRKIEINNTNFSKFRSCRFAIGSYMKYHNKCRLAIIQT